MAFCNSEEARRAAAKSIETRRQQRVLPVALPKFTSVEAVQEALELLARLASTKGKGQGMSLASGVKACEVWLKAEDHRLDLERVKALEQRIRELEAELKTYREPWKRND